MKWWVFFSCWSVGAVVWADDISQAIRDHESRGVHPGAVTQTQAFSGLTLVLLFGGGLVGVIYGNIAKRMDSHSQKIDGVSAHLNRLGAQVESNTSFRGAIQKDRFLENARRVNMEMVAVLNAQREERGLPPIVLE